MPCNFWPSCGFFSLVLCLPISHCLGSFFSRLYPRFLLILLV
ncbi:hypothetical protein OIU79_020111 [Salix purpurea]|uniref:Uncharacterized protein n=1 Tax=Salix purpurea TaxID=77065 RepID=A0A9Q0P2R3_SALPP|nr:hypothetical protein OIU79_020111 [Salix purpurea]